VLAGAAAVLIAGALAALLLGGGDDTPTAARTTPTQPPRDTPSVASDPLPIATRPNSITIAGGKVWALSTKSGEIVVLDARDSHQIDRIGIGEGGTSVAAGFKSVWAVKGNSGALIRRSARTRRTIPGSDATISVPGQPISIATGEGAVWVGVRKKGVRDGSAEAVVRVDPSTPEQRAIPIPGGVQDVAVGAGAVWVTTTFRNSVIRIDARDTSRIKEIAVGRMPNGIAVGYGAVWVAAADSDQLVRISPRGFVTDRIPLKFSPTRVTAGGGSIWVTAREANRLIRVDPKRRAVREQIDTGGRPFALDVARDAVWVTLLNEGVQRIRYVR
jgi:streptogramin lyase